MNKEKRVLKSILLTLLSILSYWSVSLVEAESTMPLHKLDPVLKRFVRDQGAMYAPSVSLPLVRTLDLETVSAIIKVSGSPTSIESAGARVREGGSDRPHSLGTRPLSHDTCCFLCCFPGSAVTSRISSLSDFGHRPKSAPFKFPRIPVDI